MRRSFFLFTMLAEINCIQICRFFVPYSRSDKITWRHQTGLQNLTVALNGIYTIPAKFQRPSSPVSQFTSLMEVFKFEKMRDQLIFSHLDFDCNKILTSLCTCWSEDASGLSRISIWCLLCKPLCKTRYVRCDMYYVNRWYSHFDTGTD